MMISLICAASENDVIGNNNQLPWHLPADLKRFKKITLGHSILMGRKTFESIGKPLPGRTNIVISRKKELQCCGALVAESLDDALTLCRDQAEVFIIGGSEIFQQALPQADQIYLTRIHQTIEGDIPLFKIDSKEWAQTHREDFDPDEANQYRYSFITLKRTSQKGSGPYTAKEV
jgi:dihydrofolate reductase